MNRLYNLDYLRGLAAFGIMIYHYLSWTFGKFEADTFMQRIGTYGVSIFYVLSGLALYHVYYDKMKPSRQDIVEFFKKRIFRIFPLFWLVTITVIVLSRKIPDFSKLFLNLTGLFGFVKWDSYFATGGWSIGNELVFYVFFPFFILFTKRFRWLMVLLSVVLFGLYLYFTFVKLNPNLTLSEQWRNYINPLNQVFFFLSGFLIGFFLHKHQIKNSIIIILLFFGIALFTFYPEEGNSINIVTGTSRLIFTACCLLICICFYKLKFTFPMFIHKPLTLLGEASYSVYLLHPIVYKVIWFGFLDSKKYLFHFLESILLIICVIVTLLISYLIYQHFEKFFMKLSR